MQAFLSDRPTSNVYFALQANPGENSDKRTFAVQKCGEKPYEINLRFAGCCMKCGACFASGYSWINTFEGKKRVTNRKTVNDLINDYEMLRIPSGYTHYNWLRVLGGEPLLNDEYISFLFDALINISKKDSAKFNDGVIIQTNGIFIGQGNTNTLKSKLKDLSEANPKVKVSIEVSIKGTNADEFELITRGRENRSPEELADFKKKFGWNLEDYSTKELFDFNLRAYYLLKEISDGLPNLYPTIIAGFGINESYLLNEGKSPNRITIISKNNKPIYHPSLWSKDFAKLYADFTNEAPRIFGARFEKMPMYGIKDQFGYMWAVMALRQGCEIYGNRWYDAKYAVERGDRNSDLENAFADILDKFFLVNNQIYYSTLINPHTDPILGR